MWNKGGWSDSLLWALGSVDHKALDKNCKESMDSAHYSRYSSQSCHSSHNSHSSYSSQYRTDTAKESMASVHQATSAMLYQRIKACWRTSWTQTLHKLNTNGTSWTQFIAQHCTSWRKIAQSRLNIMFEIQLCATCLLLTVTVLQMTAAPTSLRQSFLKMGLEQPLSRTRYIEILSLAWSGLHFWDVG